jgi:hypothetical protein
MALSVSVYGRRDRPRRAALAPLGDRVSRKLSLSAGMAVFILSTVLRACAIGTGLFFTGRALAALAAGAFVPTAYAFVGDQIPYADRAKAMGILVSSWSLSLSCRRCSVPAESGGQALRIAPSGTNLRGDRRDVHVPRYGAGMPLRPRWGVHRGVIDLGDSLLAAGPDW